MAACTGKSPTTYHAFPAAARAPSTVRPLHLGSKASLDEVSVGREVVPDNYVALLRYKRRLNEVIWIGLEPISTTRARNSDNSYEPTSTLAIINA